MLTSLDRFGEDTRVAPVIVSELEFRNIQRQVLAADFVIGADHAALYEGPEALNGVGVDRAEDVLPSAVVDGPVRLGERAIDLEVIVRNQADLVGNSLLHEVGHGAEIDAAD